LVRGEKGGGEKKQSPKPGFSKGVVLPKSTDKAPDSQKKKEKGVAHPPKKKGGGKVRKERKKLLKNKVPPSLRRKRDVRKKGGQPATCNKRRGGTKKKTMAWKPDKDKKEFWGGDFHWGAKKEVIPILEA